MGRYYIDKYTGTLEKTDLYLVKLTKKDGTVVENLEPRMLFPFSNQDMYITLLDENEKEYGFVRKMDEIDEPSQKALKECFKEYYMIPRITAILDCEDKFGVLKWKVDTDRGIVSFQIRNRHSDIKPMGKTGRVLIRDSNDNRYEITDHTKMDPKSLRILFSYI